MHEMPGIGAQSLGHVLLASLCAASRQAMSDWRLVDELGE